MRSKKNVSRALNKISRSGRLHAVISHLRNTLRYFLIGETVFDAMGIKYLGPINGHSLSELIEMLRRAKECQTPVIVHAITVKGCGYQKAEDNPEKYHGIAAGKNNDLEKKNYAAQFGETMMRLAEKDASICTVSAGMTYNTGLLAFSEKYPDRSFDTGIAEQHALTMAGGLAKGGMRPFVVIYSTFLQRGFDQVFHDICLQKLPVTVCVDHAGLTGEDGATHQGVFDLGFLRSMPELCVLAPRDTDEFDRMLEYASHSDTPTAIRYPKGCTEIIEGDKFEKPDWAILRKGENGSIVTFGACLDVGAKVAENLNMTLIDARSLKPLDEECLEKIKNKPICVIEDNASAGGLYDGILEYFACRNVKVIGFSLKDKFVDVGTVEEQRRDNGLDADSITEKLKNEIG